MRLEDECCFCAARTESEAVMQSILCDLHEEIVDLWFLSIAILERQADDFCIVDTTSFACDCEIKGPLRWVTEKAAENFLLNTEFQNRKWES